MNSVTIALLLSMCFCALCGATPAVSSLDKELIPSNSNNEVATKLQRVTRQTSTLLNLIEGILSQLFNIPRDLVTNIVNIIFSVIRDIKLRFLSWITTIESLLEKPLALPNNSQNSNQRRRRSNVSNGLSDLIGNLPKLLQLPLNDFQNVTSSNGDSAGGQVRNIVKMIGKLIWNFIIMEILPWLRNVLYKLKQSNILPPLMNDTIENVDSLYLLMRIIFNIIPTSS